MDQCVIPNLTVERPLFDRLDFLWILWLSSAGYSSSSLAILPSGCSFNISQSNYKFHLFVVLTAPSFLCEQTDRQLQRILGSRGLLVA